MTIPSCAHDVRARANAYCIRVPLASVSHPPPAHHRQWSTHRKEYGLSVWALSDEEGGEFSVVHIPERGDDFQEVVREKLREAGGLRRVPPSFALLLGSPGAEEQTLESIGTALGEGVPVLGGSSADNKVQVQCAYCSALTIIARTFRISADGRWASEFGPKYPTSHTHVFHTVCCRAHASRYNTAGRMASNLEDGLDVLRGQRTGHERERRRGRGGLVHV